MPAEAFLGLLPIMGGAFLFYAIKLLVDARTRNKLIASNRSDEFIRAYLEAESERRRRAPLRWGVVLVCLACGVGLMGILGLEIDEHVSLVAVAILLGATAIGTFAAYALERRSPRREFDGEPQEKRF